MPQALIVIFMLFFAVLAFGWFYWQRAKARDAGKVTDADANTTSASTSDAPVTDATASDVAPASTSTSTTATDQQ
jgi:predicted negative regulator of RcsB-dependent stress response